MNLRQQVRLLLFWASLYLHSPDDGAAVTASDTNSQIRLEKISQVKPKIPVSVSVGNAIVLQCGNETSQGSVMWWQTPFGSFGGRHKFSNKDPIDIIRGNLRIPKVTLSHTGIYSCHLVDSKGTTVISYKVNILSEIKPRMRTAREAVKSTRLYSDTDLVGAVSSSVLISFIGAFTLGALSQPYVIKCLQRARARIRPNTSSRQDTTRLGAVFYRRNPNPEDNTVDFVPESSAQSLQTSNIKTDQDESQPERNSDSINELASDGSDQTNDPERERHRSGLGSEPITRTHPKRVSRVIKLYNYDEDGNRFSHIKEPEDNPTPRQRVMSLTRLQSIMNEVETPDFSSSGDSTQPDEVLSMT
ncbi:hypothetical protein Baya_15378 [Bagarius yarrelli]|uniref:Ig-like domain-containing protein n=1 Tax=Bagarius yarrelli TaxID=175774 RepID=A0A556VBW0_BAGYA|nr:hypothetical protein Baya_15378 [Bagarius yarrelli]